MRRSCELLFVRLQSSGDFVERRHSEAQNLDVMTSAVVDWYSGGLPDSFVR